MSLGKKIKELRESNSVLQRELAAMLNVGESYLSKVETDHKVLKREYLIHLSEYFNYPLSELEALWLGTKVYDLIKNETQGLSALKVAEEQINYEVSTSVK